MNSRSNPGNPVTPMGADQRRGAGPRCEGLMQLCIRWQETLKSGRRLYLMQSNDISVAIFTRFAGLGPHARSTNSNSSANLRRPIHGGLVQPDV